MENFIAKIAEYKGHEATFTIEVGGVSVSKSFDNLDGEILGENVKLVVFEDGNMYGDSIDFVISEIESFEQYDEDEEIECYNLKTKNGNTISVTLFKIVL